jgi:agmatine deiminase
MSNGTVSRRAALLGFGAFLTGCAEGAPEPEEPEAVPAAGRRFGAEWEPQARTFMSWPTSDIWAEQIGAVQGDIARLARAISAFQPVVLLAEPELVGEASAAVGAGVEVVPIPVNDLWARDTLPVFVEDGGRVRGVDLNFNGWGGKQSPRDADAVVADAVLARYRLDRIGTRLVGEGGSLETDGEGTLLVTESSLVNANRNPGMSRDRIEAELKALLGVRKVIWFAGVKGQDITDAHVDCLVRFTAPGRVLLDTAFPGGEPDVWSRSADQARSVLSTATDALGRPITVVELPQPDPEKITGTGDEFVSTYLNFYVANKAVFAPRFGDAAADDAAAGILREQFPGREIVQLPIDGIAGGGGGIHCATHDQPA